MLIFQHIKGVKTVWELPTATDKHRVRCYDVNTRAHSNEEAQDKIGTVGEGDS
jgi:hypothetical protein